MKKVIIIGGGLSGLTIAYNLKKQNVPFLILEAQGNLGGRINTIKGVLNSPMEMGATWFNNSHTHLIQLLEELEKLTEKLQKEELFNKADQLKQNTK